MTFKFAKSLITAALALATLGLAGCAHAPPDDPRDPLEPFNRAMFGFNRTADRYVLKPVAKTYARITPDPIQNGVSNFFNNLEEPRNIVNNLLQAKFVRAASDTGRFVLNSTAGFAGVMDVATDVGLERSKEDFGQTLGHYGVGEGWYLMLPLLGPTTNRDLLGRAADYPTSANSYISSPTSYGVTAANILDTRTKLLSADSLLDNALDPYIFVRTAYLQQRLTQVYDGSPPARLMYGDDDQ